MPMRMTRHLLQDVMGQRACPLGESGGCGDKGTSRGEPLLLSVFTTHTPSGCLELELEIFKDSALNEHSLGKTSVT